MTNKLAEAYDLIAQFYYTEIARALRAIADQPDVNIKTAKDTLLMVADGLEQYK